MARLLKNPAGRPAGWVRQRLTQLLSRIRQAAAPRVEPAVGQQLRHFVKVTKSYWPGLFACYGCADIPRTNNDLEHLFGSHRYHERRSSGRKRGRPSLVVSGSVRVVSGLATRLRPEEGLALPEGYVESWRRCRAAVDQRRQARRQQRRFRHAPKAYLQKLEDLAVQLSLLP